MDGLLQRLLEIAQLDTYKERVQFIFQDIGETIRLIAADYIPILETQMIEMDIHIPEQPVYATFDQPLIERAVRNLIENAIRYGKKGKFLGIILKETEDHVHITVVDHGPGIASEKQKLIFDRFYRGAEGRGGEGLGLGLSIVKEVVHAHKGSIAIESVPNVKTAFTISLPTSYRAANPYG